VPDLPGPAESMPDVALLAGESGRSLLLERGGGPVPWYQSWAVLQQGRSRRDHEERPMVGTPERQRQILDEVASLYAWIDARIAQDAQRCGRCTACGACCDFAAYDHRLYVTPPELLYLAHSLRTIRLKPLTSGGCPYQENGKCSVREHRFSSCRIFCCSGDAAFQSDVSEAAIKRLKAICERFEIPYRYADLGAALAAFSSDTCLSAEARSRGDCANRCT
jgi:Fe-S-cluster containining protein